MNDIFSKHDLEIIFITGSDPDEYSNIQIQDDDALVISSKSFGTLETLSSYKEVCGNNFYHNTFAITANKSKALDFGIHEENIVSFDSSTGGRFSIWSPINLVLCLLEGEKGYKDFLKGGKEMDDACLKSPEENPALQLSVQDIIYNNLLNVETTLVMNYDYKLRNFISFAQQVEMESNGKSIDSNNNKVDYQKRLKKVKRFFIDEMKVDTIRFPETSSLGVKPISVEGTERLVRSAINYAISQRRRSLTLVHKGNIMKFTEGKFKESIKWISKWDWASN